MTDDDDRDVDTIARLLVTRRPKSWLLLIELVNVSELIALAEAWNDRLGSKK